MNPSEHERHDAVNNPSHYTSGTIECIDAMLGLFGPNAVAWFCRCNGMKYIARAGKKEGACVTQDLEKAIWYLNKEVELRTVHSSMALD